MPLSADHRVAVYTGVFDPVHNGHLDVIQRGSTVFDRLVVGVGINPEKAPFFTQEERVRLLRKVVAPYANVEVREFKGLAVRFVAEVGARIMLRGLRTTSDMEYEFTMSIMNAMMDPEVETMFLMAREHFAHVNGTLLRQIATMGGNLDPFLPPDIRDVLAARATKGKK